MNQETPFSKGITQYITMALHIWPALQLSLPHLHEATAPPAGSPIPNHNYSSMKPQQFMQIIIKDMLNYILQHDVKQEHIIDYLDDILAILNAEQQNSKTMTHMANQLILLMQELPEGNNSRLVNFRFVYNALKGQNLGHVVKDQQQGESQSDGQHSHHGSEDCCDDEDNQMEEQNQEQNQNKQKMEGEQVPKLIQSEMQKEEDDGWVIVKKKSSRK